MLKNDPILQGGKNFVHVVLLRFKSVRDTCMLRGGLLCLRSVVSSVSEKIKETCA